MIEAAAFAAFDARLDPASPEPLAVAVSGGGDSMALMRMAADWAARHRRPLQVLTVDHGLSADSRRWVCLVEEAAAALGLVTRVLRWTGEKPTIGLPAAARIARHALLADAAREAGARVVLMGHTLDDALEGEVMRAEGSTLGRMRDWSPSPAWPQGRGVFLLRPLLGLRRAELREWLAAEGAIWVEDPANTDPRFARSRARAALSSGTSEASAEADLPASTGDRAVLRLRPLVRGDERGLLWGPRAGWNPHSLTAALLCAGGATRGPRGAQVTALLDRLESDAAFTSTLAGARIEAVDDGLVIGRDLGRTPPQPTAARAGLVWDGRFEIETDHAGTVLPLRGRLARLAPADRADLAAAPPWHRPTVPVLQAPDGSLRTLRKRSLVHERWLAACGAFAREAELPAQDRGAAHAEALSVSGI